jgi:3-phosphoshikimate 1-carboxyvinyltransferase
LILASLFLDGTSIIKETIKTRDHTERMLQFFDYPISIDDKIISINGNGTIFAKDIRIPSDISSASFLIVGALIAPNSNIILKSIGINPLRTGIIDVLIKMGADIKMVNHTNIGNEPVADIIVRSSILKPVNLSGDIISRLIDELPILFIACACCEGISVIKDIGELRHKESDRIKSMEVGLSNLGIKVESTTNSITISGGSFKGGIVNSNSDHRVAMSFLIAGLVSLKPITIIDTDNINTSFPNFVDILRDQNNEIYDL